MVAFYLFQAAILLGSPPVTAALCATSPILVAPIAARWLGERMPWTALGTLLAVGGVVLVVWTERRAGGRRDQREDRWDRRIR